MRFFLPALLLVGAPALATPSFPSTVQQQLQLDAAPTCGLCHGGDQPGAPLWGVGLALQQRGLVAFDDASLEKALERLAADATDTDADGVSDVDELRAGTDPNVASGSSQPHLAYGCGAEAAPALFALGPALTLLLARARRRSVL